MTNISRSNVQIGSYVGRDATNTVIEGGQVSEEQWRQITKFAAQNEENDEYGQVREVETLLKESKTEEAGNTWSRIRSFFASNLAHAANVAQIASLIDQIIDQAIKHGGH